MTIKTMNVMMLTKMVLTNITTTATNILVVRGPRSIAQSF